MIETWIFLFFVATIKSTFFDVNDHVGTRSVRSDTEISWYSSLEIYFLTSTGAINRYRDGRPDSPSTTPQDPNSYRGRGAGRRPYQRTPLFSPLKIASRGSHPYSRTRASAPVSRHRTLIVSQQDSTPPDSTPSGSTPPQGQWVTKRDRHMQLINASVYSERAQARQEQISSTQKQKLLERQGKRDKFERMKLYGFLKRKGKGNQVSVLGNLFKVVAQGNKLEKFQGMISCCV